MFPDLPGVGAMGDTVAESALRDHAVEAEIDGKELAVPSSLQSIEAPIGNRLVSIPLLRTRAKALAPD